MPVIEMIFHQITSRTWALFRLQVNVAAIRLILLICDSDFLMTV